MLSNVKRDEIDHIQVSDEFVSLTDKYSVDILK